MQGVITDLVEHGFEVLILQTGSSIRFFSFERFLLIFIKMLLWRNGNTQMGAENTEWCQANQY